MTSTPAPDAAVQIVWKTLADFLGPDRYRAEQVVAALAAAGWLDDPERRAARQVDHDAVVAERDALAERVAELENASHAMVGALSSPTAPLYLDSGCVDAFYTLRAALAERPPVPHE